MWHRRYCEWCIACSVVVAPVSAVLVAPVSPEVMGPIVMAEAVVSVMVSITVTITIHIIVMTVMITVMAHTTGSLSGMVETVSKTAHARSDIMTPVAEHRLKLAPPALKISGRMGETTFAHFVVMVSVSVIIVMVSVSVIMVRVSVSVIIVMVPVIIASMDNIGMRGSSDVRPRGAAFRRGRTIDVRTGGAAAFASNL